MRSPSTDTTEQKRSTDPQGKRSEDADEAFEEEIGNNPVAVAVGLQPRIGDRQHSKQEGQPVQPALRFGRLGRFPHALFDFKLNELPRPASPEQKRKTEGREGGEDGGPYR